MVHLRPYQKQAISDTSKAFALGKKAVLFVLPTGGGKSIVLAEIARLVKENKKRALILVHRQELIRQLSNSLRLCGVEHGIIASGKPMITRPIQLGSVQTVVRRIGKFPTPDLIIQDEAHHLVAGNSWGKVVGAFPNAKIFGVTATPCRLDGRGLGREDQFKRAVGFFETIITGPSMQNLITMGFLSKPKILAPPNTLDFHHVKTKAGDFDQSEIQSMMDQRQITGDVIAHYNKYLDGGTAIAFCCGVKHAEHVARQFDAVGISAESIDGKMSSETREKKLADLGAGKIKILTSADLIGEGIDVPSVDGAILLRPTQSLSLYLQQVGRALRTAPGKHHAVILDHVGNTLRHGMPQDDREWSLNGIEKRGRKSDKNEAIKARQCPSCYAVHPVEPICPECGHVYEIKTRKDIKNVDGELEEIDYEEFRRQQKREVARAQTLEELIAIGKNRGYKKGWAYYVWQSRNARRFTF